MFAQSDIRQLRTARDLASDGDVHVLRGMIRRGLVPFDPETVSRAPVSMAERSPEPVDAGVPDMAEPGRELSASERLLRKAEGVERMQRRKEREGQVSCPGFP